MAVKNKSRFRKFEYFLLGVLLAVCLMILTGALGSSFGRYQVSAWSGGGIGYGAFVVDTTTGETKIVYLNSSTEKQNRLGIPFAEF